MGLSLSIAFVLPRHRDFSGVFSWAKPKLGVALEAPDRRTPRRWRAVPRAAAGEAPGLRQSSGAIRR